MGADPYLIYYTPETKQQWVEAGGSALNKAKSIVSDKRIHRLIDSFEKGRTVTGELSRTVGF